MIGQAFGKWKVIAETERKLTKKNLKACICQCECGTKRIVAEQYLTSGRSKSCGNCTPWRKWVGPKEAEK
jgi:hypothetical protein